MHGATIKIKRKPTMCLSTIRNTQYMSEWVTPWYQWHPFYSVTCAIFAKKHFLWFRLSRVWGRSWGWRNSWASNM